MAVPLEGDVSSFSVVMAGDAVDTDAGPERELKGVHAGQRNCADSAGFRGQETPTRQVFWGKQRRLVYKKSGLTVCSAGGMLAG
jgi:hypothetical protein